MVASAPSFKADSCEPRPYDFVMDQRLVFGLGVSIILGFARWRYPTVHRFFASAGIAIGLSLVIWSMMPFIRLGPAFLAIAGFIAIALAIEWQLAKVEPTSETAVLVPSPTRHEIAVPSEPPITTETQLKRNASGNVLPSLAMKVIRRRPASTVNEEPTNAHLGGAGNTHIVDQIGLLIEEGQAIQARFMLSDDANAIKEEQLTWSQTVEAFLAKDIGKAQATQFHVTDANPWDGQPSGRSEVGGFHWAKIVARNRLLAQYMVEAQPKGATP